MVNLEKDWVNLVLRFDHCIFLSLIRNQVTNTINNKTNKHITILKTSVAVGIQIDETDFDNVGGVVVVVWNSQHASLQQPLLQL